MMNIGDLYQRADWKSEKHVPVIEAPDEVKVDEVFDVKISIGKEVSHPNTTEHHISWIRLYFHPDGDKFSYEVGNYEFNAHGESAEGPNTGPVYTHHGATAALKIKKSGTLYATSLCNIHGLWENAKVIRVK